MRSNLRRDLCKHRHPAQDQDLSRNLSQDLDADLGQDLCQDLSLDLDTDFNADRITDRVQGLRTELRTDQHIGGERICSAKDYMLVKDFRPSRFGTSRGFSKRPIPEGGPTQGPKQQDKANVICEMQQQKDM